MDYKSSGVDVEAGRKFVDEIKNSVESTYDKGVIGGIGGFGGCMRIPSGYSKPVLVAGTDGVGTKLELAQAYSRHFEVGIDLVAMCVNDVVTNGSKPLFFLDYIATGKLSSESLSEVVRGIAHACKFSACSLIGGETAEMPGFYPNGKYDLAGFCVGIIEEEKIIDGHKFIEKGHKIIGIESSGFHSNGFSLIRKVISTITSEKTSIEKDSLIEEVMNPTHIYAPLINAFSEEQIPIKGMSHITGGGLIENLPRCIPNNLAAEIDLTSWKIPELFGRIQKIGQIPEIDMWNTFNQGIGLCVIVESEYAMKILDLTHGHGFKSWVIGDIILETSDKKRIYGLPC